jgi:hypothetical protein
MTFRAPIHVRRIHVILTKAEFPGGAGMLALCSLRQDSIAALPSSE